MDKIELLKKIKSLSIKGVGGEKINAEKMLKELMLKYQINENEFNDEDIKSFEIKWKNETELKLLIQVFYSVVGNIDLKKAFYTYKHYKKHGCLDCTKSEFVEVMAKFKFYLHHYNEDLKIFYQAFINTNNIFPDDSKKKQKEETKKYFLSDEDIKIIKLSESLDNHSYHKQIELK